ncbi:MAG: B12-binding domain-containing radical SAM protein [Acidobacteria bacterium]|nr:B12-binding domain-containing radical SAM protein [Acidobacteriota bacterium]
MRPKVVLYNPSAVFYTMPLALVAVGSALDRSGIDVDVIDGRLESDPVGRVVAASEDALCLGMSVLTGSPLRDALQVARAVKTARPRLPIVWGGWHPSLFPKECLAEPVVDAAVVGQGERTFAEMVERLAQEVRLPLDSARGTLSVSRRVKPDSAPYDVPGSATRRGGVPVLHPPRALEDINHFPAHDYSLIPVERYFALKGRRQLDYISSQGCRFRCAFCADPNVYSRGWVGLEPRRIGDELESLWRRYRFDEVSFQDETFFTQASRVDAICDEFLSRRLPVRWTATMRADQGFRLEESLFAKARRAGLSRVMIGVESGSQAMLDWMKKDMKIDHVMTAAERCARHDIGVIFNFIVGFPDEPAASFAQTLALVKRLRAMRPDFETQIFYFRPYPGTQLADYARARGYQFPATLEAWADFDYVGRRGPWVSEDQWRLVERFKFYSRHAWSGRGLARWPLRAAARWRCRRDQYAFPIEKQIVEWLRPPEPVS